MSRLSYEASERQRAADEEGEVDRARERLRVELERLRKKREVCACLRWGILCLICRKYFGQCGACLPAVLHLRSSFSLPLCCVGLYVCAYVHTGVCGVATCFLEFLSHVWTLHSYPAID